MKAIRAAVIVVVNLLVDGSYETLEAMTHGRRLSADALRGAITDYGATPVPPPEAAFENLDVVQVDGAVPPTFDVVVDLWSAEEGRSDLSLELRLIEKYRGAFDVEILDLHVL